MFHLYHLNYLNLFYLFLILRKFHARKHSSDSLSVTIQFFRVYFQFGGIFNRANHYVQWYFLSKVERNSKDLVNGG